LAARIDFPEVKYSKRGTLIWELVGLEKKRLALGGRAIALRHSVSIVGLA